MPNYMIQCILKKIGTIWLSSNAIMTIHVMKYKIYACKRDSVCL